MRVNEVFSRVEDTEVICLHLQYYIIIGYKHEIKRDVRFVNEHIGDWLVTDICVQKVNKESVLAITAFKHSKEVKTFKGGERMRLDDFLKTVSPTTELEVDLVTAEPEEKNVIADGVKKEVIPTLISKDIAELDMFDIYEVRLTYTSVGDSTNTYPIIYVLAKENYY